MEYGSNGLTASLRAAPLAGPTNDYATTSVPQTPAARMCESIEALNKLADELLARAVKVESTLLGPMPALSGKEQAPNIPSGLFATAEAAVDRARATLLAVLGSVERIEGSL